MTAKGLNLLSKFFFLLCMTTIKVIDLVIFLIGNITRVIIWLCYEARAIYHEHKLKEE